MTGSIGSISSIGVMQSTLQNSFASSQKLTDETKMQLQYLGIDTKNITTEAQGQAILAQAMQAQQALQAQVQKSYGNGKAGSKGGNSEIKTLKEQASELAEKVGITVSSSEKLSDIMSALAPVISAKVSAAGNDKTKIAQAKELESEYNSISASLANIKAQHEQSKQSSQTLNTSLNNMAVLNMIFHKI